MGITSGVYISTRTVHNLPMTPEGRPTYFQAEETVPVDNPSVYGLTKGIGERVCQYFATHFGMRLIALRITGPRTREAFIAERRIPIHPGLYVMDEEDLANAILAALDVAQVGAAASTPSSSPPTRVRSTTTSRRRRCSSAGSRRATCCWRAEGPAPAVSLGRASAQRPGTTAGSPCHPGSPRATARRVADRR